MPEDNKNKSIDTYKDIDDVRKNIKARKGSMGEEIESFSKDVPATKQISISPKERALIKKNLEDSSKGYARAEKDGFTHTNKAKSFNEKGEKDE